MFPANRANNQTLHCIGHKRDNNAYINILSEKSLIVSPSNSKMLSYGRNYNESLQKNDANSS